MIGDVPLWLLPDPVVDLTLVEKRNEWSEVSDIRKLVNNYIGRNVSQLDPRTQIVGAQEQALED